MHPFSRVDESEPAICPSIILSDHMVREAGTNKLSLIGVFNRWNVTSFPFSTPPFCITVTFTNFRYSEKPVEITVRIESSSGHVLASLSPTLKFNNPSMGPNDQVELPLRVPGMNLPSPGTYNVVVLVNGDLIAKRAFAVNSVTLGPNQIRS